MQASVNILVATYNGEKYFDELMQSLLKQTYSNIKIFILDDGSKDNTKNIITKYLSDKVKLIPNDKNLGYPFSFYKLITDCEPADYYCLCDQDDVWYPDKVEKSIKILEQYNNQLPQLCFSAFEYCDENLIHLRDSDIPPENISFLKTFFQCYMWGFTTVFNETFRQKFIKKLPVKTRDEDYWFHMMAVAFGEIHYNPVISAKHRRHGKNHSQDPTSFLRFQLWRIKYFLFNNQFSVYHNMLQEFYQYYRKDLKPSDRKALFLFQSDGNSIKKAFYPKRLRNKIFDEIMLRMAFLLRKL